MKYTFGIIFILFIGIMIYAVQTRQESPSELAQTNNTAKLIEKQSPLNPSVKLLQDKCLKCHGAVKNGKKRIKGNFDLSSVTTNGVQLKDSHVWANVLDQINNKTMPPPDSGKELSSKEAASITDSLKRELNVKNLRSRRLTSTEIAHSLSSTFNFNLENFDPFESLHFSTNSGDEYPTVYSPKSMTASFLKDLEGAVSNSTKNYVLPNTYGAKYKNAVFVLWPRERRHRGSAVYVDMDYKKGPQMPPEPKNAPPEVYEKWEKAHSAFQHKKAHYERSEKKAGKMTAFDLRTNDEEYMICEGNNPRLINRNHPPGKYRLSFRAVSLNRNSIIKAYEKSKTPSSAKELWKYRDKAKWAQLVNDKARIEFRLDGQHKTDQWHERPIITGGKRGMLVKSFVIEDDIEKTYTFEFELDTPNGLTLKFVNGPSSDFQKHLSISALSIPYGQGNAQFGRPAREYKLPCVRILSQIKLERIADIQAKSKYDLSFEKNVNDSLIRKKIDSYIEELSLKHDEKKLSEFYNKLPESLSFPDKLQHALKMITMAPDFLYLDYSGEAADSSARYVSYSLLKTHPSKVFKSAYSKFRKEKLSSQEFTKGIIEDSNFDNFLRSFIKTWMKMGTVLDEKKFSIYKRQLPFDRESFNYMSYIFKNNRPVRELFDSDYKIINSSLGEFYNVKDFLKLDPQKFSVVRDPQKRGGIINQGNFYISHSSGVDPMPFRRAKWISENIFNQKIPPPPNNISTDEFVTNKKLKTFKERTEAHASSENCQSCHKILDPIAFAMHNFDTIGERIKSQDKEAEAKLLQKIAAADIKMASAFTRELISYITGRETTVYDSSQVEEIVKRTADRNFLTGDILSETLTIYFKK